MRFLPFILLLFSLQVSATNRDSLSHDRVKIPLYLHLKGTIGGKYPITMDITTTLIDGRYYSHASYYYDVFKNLIDLESAYWSGDAIRLSGAIDTNHSDNFEGRFDGEKLSGIWSTVDLIKNTSTKKMPFELMVDTLGTGFFTTYRYTDFTRVDLGKKKCNIEATYSYNLLLPSDTNAVWLTTNLCKIYGGANSISGLTKKLKDESVVYFGDFRDGIKAYVFSNHDGTVSDEDRERVCADGCSSCHNSKSITSYVEYNSGKIFAVKVEDYENSGGVHCCASENYYSYSLSDNRLIRLTEILSAKDSMIIKRLLTKHLTAKGFGKYTNLDEKKFRIPESYYFTPTGVNFVVRGLIFYWADENVFIPFSEFGDKLKRQGWIEL
jgi:hypothetical protein